MTSDVRSQYAISAYGSARYAPRRIVVDSGQADHILSLLTQFGGADRDARIPALNLSRLVIADVQQTVTNLAQSSSAVGLPRGGNPLERLMAWLRAKGREAGVEFSMGKDRVVLGGEGAPYVSPKITPRAAAGPYAGPRQLSQPEARQLPSAEAQGAGEATRVGVLDTCVINHPYFEGSAEIPADSATSDQAVEEAWQGHGTFVTGLIHRYGPNAEILVAAMPLDATGVATAWDAANGMVALRDRGARLINLSIGCVTADNQPPFALQRAAERLHDDVVLVAAAGNYDPNDPMGVPPTWPGALEDVVAVGSADAEGESSAFSPQELWVDLVAPGEQLHSTFVHGDVLCLLPSGATRTRTFRGTAAWSGTSFAAATVSGRVAALAGGAAYADLREIIDCLREGRLQDDLVRQP